MSCHALGVGILIGLAASALGGTVLGAPRVWPPAVITPAALPACSSMPFTDVPINHEFCPEITWLKNKNITSGYGDGTYRPDNAATRMAWAAFLTRYAQATLSACSVPPFTDVAVSHPFCPEIKWMKDNAISTGYGDGTYRPGNSTTRMAASAFLARVAGATLSACSTPPFSDVPINHPFCPDITWIKDNAISNGNGDGTFGPTLALTRGESAAWIYRVAVLVNDAPVVTTSAGSTAYTEGDPATVIDAGLTVTDSDDTDLESATVSITGNFQVGDALGFSDQNGIAGSWSSVTGVLSLTGTSSLANYQAALRSVTFSTTNDDPATTRTISFVANDGDADSNIATKNMTVTPVNDPPVADDETFSGADSAVGNTTLVVDDPTDGAPSASGPKKSISGDILAGDSDADGPGPLTVTPGTSATNDGGSVTIEADGDFVFTPAAGTSCTDTSDSFDYTVNDNDPIDPQTDTGSVTIAITGCVWYVNNNDPGNSGTSNAPFDTLAQAETASAAGHTIFIFDGDNTTTGYSTGITLKANQQLLGEDANLVIGSDTLWTATANRPTITDNNADVVELASANTVKGIEIDPQGTGGGIAGGSGDAGGTIDDVRIIDTGTAGTQPGLELDGTTGTWNISNLTVSTNGATGVRLNNAGTINFAAAGTISITTTGARGLEATSTNMGAGSVFDDITVSGSGSGAVSMTSTTGTTTFGDGSGTDLALTTTSGATGAFVLSNAGTVTVPAGGTANTSATGGPAIDVTGTAGAALAFDDVDSTNSSTDGINLDGLGAGTFSATSGDITGAAGISFDLNGGSGDITYPGNFGNGSGTTAIEVTGRSGGAVSLSGSISDSSDAGGGLNLSSNTGGSTTLSNATKQFNTGASAAVTFNTSDGHTLTLSGGGLDIDTTSGNGLAATTSGTLVVTGTVNTITTTTGTALNVTNTDIGASGLTFESISANGAPNGIVLNATGSSGGLTVTGTGAANSGGTIQNTTGDGIVLTNASDVSLTNCRILNAGGHGINATNLAGVNLLTTPTIQDWDTGNTATKNGINLVNNNVNMTSLTVTGGTFNGSNASNDGVFMEAQGTSAMTLNVQSSAFTDMFGDGIQVNGITGATGDVRATVQSSSFTTAAALGNGGISLQPFGGIHLYVDINGNTFDDIMRPTTNLGAITMTNGSTAAADFTIRNNTINDIDGARGITITADGTGPTKLLIDNNSINRLGSTTKHGISVNLVSAATAEVTIANNLIGQAANLWTAGDGTGNPILLLTQNTAVMNGKISNNVVSGNTSSVIEVVRVRAINTSTLNAIVTGNTISDTSGTHVEFDATAGSGGAIAGTINLNIGSTANTLPAGGVVQLTENAIGDLNVMQASAAAVSAANSGATVTVTGTPDYSSANPPTPVLPTLP